MNPHELYISLTAKISVNNYNLLSLGKTLKDLKNNDNYKMAVGDIDTWQHFVKQPEVSLTVGEANKLIEIYELYVEELGYSEEQLSSIPHKNLRITLPIIKEGVQNPDEILEQARTLSDKDLKDALIETKDNLEEVQKTYQYIVMKKCNETGNLSKIHDITSDEIKLKLKL